MLILIHNRNLQKLALTSERKLLKSLEQILYFIVKSDKDVCYACFIQHYFASAS